MYKNVHMRSSREQREKKIKDRNLRKPILRSEYKKRNLEKKKDKGSEENMKRKPEGVTEKLKETDGHFPKSVSSLPWLAGLRGWSPVLETERTRTGCSAREGSQSVFLSSNDVVLFLSPPTLPPSFLSKSNKKDNVPAEDLKKKVGEHLNRL